MSSNQTTIYGTDLSLDATTYSVELTNWKASDGPRPDLTGILRDGDVYIDGYATTNKMPNGQLPKEVGTYQVMISSQLLNRLTQKFSDYDWDAVGEGTGLTRSEGPVEAEHDPATYVIKQAEATVKINGAQHIKYGEAANIQYGGTNGYTISITAPANGITKTIYADATFDASDLQFVTNPGNVGSYTVKLSDAGLRKLVALTGSSNYDWQQATDSATTPTATFYVDQLPVAITVGKIQTVNYGSPEWLSIIQNGASGYTVTASAPGYNDLNDSTKQKLAVISVVAGDFAYLIKPGNVGQYKVVLTKQGFKHIKDQLGTNFDFPQDVSDVSSQAKLVIVPGQAEADVNGSWAKNFGDLQEWPKAEQLKNTSEQPGAYNLGQLTIYTADGQAVKIDLIPSDLAIVGFADGQMPTAVGTYSVTLSESGQRRIKALLRW